MICSAMTSSSLSLPRLPRLSFHKFGRTDFCNEGSAFRNYSCDYRRVSRQLASPCVSRKLQFRMASPLGYKKSSFVLGGFHKRKTFLWQSGADRRCRVQFETIGKPCKRDLCRRGLKRSLKARSSNLRCCPEARGDISRCRDQNALGTVPSVANRLLRRKKLRSWEDDGYDGTLSHNAFDGDVSPDQAAALATLEQAIQSQVVEETRLFFGGPSRGDLAEVEAFCRIYRLAEQLHFTVMNVLRSINENPGNNPGPNSEDASLAEERIASALAYLMAVLQESKSEILRPKSSLNGGGFSAQQGPSDLPYFARLRKDVRARCRTVVAALDALKVRADSAQSLAIQTQILKLENAALDAGFPRPEGMPSPGDIPNLAPVRLRPSKGGRSLFKDEEGVTFWRGGQMTEAGMHWLVQKGFKTIVDMREGSAQSIVESARSEAVASGRVRVVRMSVESGQVPTKEHVNEFAHLVEDAENRPLYLLTRAGVSRASAMVSRWREFVLRGQVQSGAVEKEIEQGTLSGDLEVLTGDDAVKISQEDALALETALVRTVDESMASYALEDDDGIESGDAIGGLDEASVSWDDRQEEVGKEEASTSEDGRPTPDGVEVASTDKELVNASANGRFPQGDRSIDVTKNAFEAQRPVPNILSRKAMSKFMKRRKVPAIFLTSRINRANGNFASTSNIADSLVNSSIGGPDNRWGLSSPSSPSRVGLSSSETSSRLESEQTAAEVNSPTTNGSYTAKANGNGSSGVSRGPPVNGSASSSVPAVERNIQEDNERADRPSGDPLYVTAPEGGPDGSEMVTLEEDDDDIGSVQGDMCASTTGVVRVQSRKKAEMYLVRTDGYSCTRERVKESTLGFSHPSTQQQMLMWKTAPRTVLILKKLGSELTKETQEVASFLHYQEGMNVMVEPDVHDTFARMPGFGFIQTFHSQDTSELHERVDFVVCLGGDGVILHVSNLFRNAVPPVVSFNLGSLGFLTSHSYSSHKEDLHSVIHGYNDMMTGVYITLRMRLRCELYRDGIAIPGKIFDVLNEVVVDRGSNPYLSKIECYERDRLITKVQADGVIVATPTGSTAYSIAAGGSMVHPNVPCMLFTPICPHSLSFRPVILPDSAVLELKVPGDARSNAWVSFDGKRRQQLSRGDSVRITMSEHPLPTVNKSDQTDDWFQSLVRCLSWNERLEQRPLSPT